MLVYQYFWTQRCGVAVTGWHDAGDYNKFPHGFAGDGSIPAARQLDNDTAVSLGSKPLYLKKAGYGYVEEPNRASGIRVEGTISPNEGAAGWETARVMYMR